MVARGPWPELAVAHSRASTRRKPAMASSLGQFTSHGACGTLVSTPTLSLGPSRVSLASLASRRCAKLVTAAAAGQESGNIEASPASSSSNATFLSALRPLVAAASAALVLVSPLQPAALAADFDLETYYGTAASASSYGGYGGNTSKKDSAEYVYDIPSAWKERAISKVEKGTNGTDSEFFNPKKRTEKVYVTFLAGFRRLPPQENVLNNLALSDVNLQDLLAAADETKFEELKKGGQTYYSWEIDSATGHALISVTSARNKLYAHFVNAKPSDWEKDEGLLRTLHNSFQTVGPDSGDY